MTSIISMSDSSSSSPVEDDYYEENLEKVEKKWKNWRKVDELELAIKMTKKQVAERVELVEKLEREINMMYNTLKIYLKMDKIVEEESEEKIEIRDELDTNLVFHGVEKDPIELEVGDDVEVKKHVLEHIINISIKQHIGIDRSFHLLEVFRY